EERITVAQRKLLTHLRGAGIHEDRPGVAVRLGKRAYALELQELSFEIELAAFRPGSLDHIEPLLGERVACIMLALGDAEHLELTLVPPDHQIDAEAPFAAVVRGHEFLGRA